MGIGCCPQGDCRTVVLSYRSDVNKTLEGIRVQEASMSGLWAVVYGSCSPQGSPDDLWVGRMQEGVAQEELCPLEQREHRLFQGQLPPREAQKFPLRFPGAAPPRRGTTGKRDSRDDRPST